MPWNWETILQELSEEDRQFIEPIRMSADMLEDLPKIERKAIEIQSHEIRGALLKAFEASYYSLDMVHFKDRLKRLEKKLKREDNFLSDRYFVFFPGANLYFLEGETLAPMCHIRITERNVVGAYGVGYA